MVIQSVCVHVNECAFINCMQIYLVATRRVCLRVHTDNLQVEFKPSPPQTNHRALANVVQHNAHLMYTRTHGTPTDVRTLFRQHVRSGVDGGDGSLVGGLLCVALAMDV